MGLQSLEAYFTEVDEKIIDFSKEHNLYPKTVRPKDLYEHARKRVHEGGKRFRSALVYAACEAFGGNVENATPYAYLFEAMHGGYLDIDDVLDKSILRRGKPSTHKLVGEERAILIGLLNCDAIPIFCLHEGSGVWDEETSKYINKLVYRVKNETVRGEYLDIAYRRSPSLKMPIMMSIYEGKTGAYTFGGPVAGGAKIGSGVTSVCDRLYIIGRDLIGPAFQITDDLLNVRKPTESPEEYIKKYGKEFADDLNEGKPTYMIAKFNEVADEEDKRKFYELFGRMNPPLSMGEKIHLIDLLDRYGIRDQAEEKAQEYAERCQEKIKEIIPLTDQSQTFYNLIGFAVGRTW